MMECTLIGLMAFLLLVVFVQHIDRLAKTMFGHVEAAHKGRELAERSRALNDGGTSEPPARRHQ